MWKFWAFVIVLQFKLTIVDCCSTTTNKPTTAKATTATPAVDYVPNPCPETFPLFVK